MPPEPSPSQPPVADFHCLRCGRAGAPRLARPPLPGAAGREVQAGICADCWGEWGRAEVMVINELRLNFMDPASQEILNRQMREFLHLPAAGAPGSPGGTAEPGGPEGSGPPAGPGGTGGGPGDVPH
jgi:Fe-S cluster biosynthesis and repair protein YggX